MIRSDREAVVRWIADVGRSLRTVEADAKSVEAGDQFKGRPRAVRGLFDRGTGGIPRCKRRRAVALLLRVLVRRQRVRRAFATITSC